MNSQVEKERGNLNRKLKALRQRKALIQAVEEFLIRNPTIAPLSRLEQMGTTVGLLIEDKARIRPVGKQAVSLRLERYFEDWEPFDDESKRLVRDDVSTLSSHELAFALLEAGIDLNNPAEYGEDNEED